MSLMPISNSGGEIVEVERDYESVQAVALAASTRAEIDSQIATAKRYPRQLSRFLSEARSVIALDPDIAESCIYKLPPRGRNSPPISGPSVRMAEIIASCWGNLRITGRIAEDAGLFLVAQGICIDLEKNVGYQVEVRRGLQTKDGRRFSDDMVNKTANGAIAIATRNATFKVVPRTFVAVLEQAARDVARGTVQSLPERWHKALDWFATKGVEPAQIYEHFGIGGPADVNLDHLEFLTGYRTALRDNLARPEEIFVPALRTVGPDPAPSPGRGTRGLSERLARTQAPSADPVPEKPATAPQDDPEALLRSEGGNDE